MNQNKGFFEENYNGILNHNGWTQVAKFNITATVKNIQNQQILVKGKSGKGSYICNLHKNLLKDIDYIDVGDTVGIKWNMGNPYIVGYRKANFEMLNPQPTGDKAVSENWTYFFDKMELGE